MRSKFWAIVVSILMVVAMMPTSVLAETEAATDGTQAPAVESTEQEAEVTQDSTAPAVKETKEATEKPSQSAASYGLKGSNAAGSTESSTTYDSSTSYPLYCYTLVPGKSLSSGEAVDKVWNGMGVGSISGVNAPSTYKSGDIITGGNCTYPGSYPKITVDGTEYTYTTDEDSEGYTYTIEWFRTVVSDGANTGSNKVNPVISSNIKTFHRDGTLKLNDHWNVSYHVQDIGESGFSIYDPENYTQRIKKGSNVTTSKLANPLADGSIESIKTVTSQSGTTSYCICQPKKGPLI